jgi:hypothetical protein
MDPRTGKGEMEDGRAMVGKVKAAREIALEKDRDLLRFHAIFSDCS